jgi:translation initiation factor IF-2
MAELDTQEQKRPLTLNRTGGGTSGGRLELRRPPESAGQVRQSFSHGRSKTVTVEVRKKRVFAPGTGPEPAAQAETEPVVARAPEQPAAEPARRTLQVPRTLTAEEARLRARAVQDAAKADAESRLRHALEEEDRRRREEEQAAEEARLKAEEDAKRRVEEEEAKKRGAEEAKQRSVEAETQRKEEESRREVAERAGKAAAAKVAALAAAGKVAMPADEEEEAAVVRRPGAPPPRRPAVPVRRDERRRSGKLTVTRALSDDDERMRSLASVRRARERERRLHRGDDQAKVVRDVIIPETITVQELANRMAERGVDVVKALMRMGVMATSRRSSTPTRPSSS